MTCKAIAIEYLKGRIPLDIMDMLKEEKVDPEDESGRCKEGTLADHEYIANESGEVIVNTFYVVKNELINASKEDDNGLK